MLKYKTHILSALVLINILVYFLFFPVIINNTISNIFIITAILVEICLIISGVLNSENQSEILLFLPHVIVINFILRILPHLRFSFPPLYDPYHYYISALTILQTGHLNSELNSWYYFADLQLHWPVLHIVLSNLTIITDINSIYLMRFLNPIIGILYFIIVFLVAREITQNIKISFLSAFAASLIDIIIFYQSEYHPQGLGFIVFLFLIYVFLKFIDKDINIPQVILFLVFTTVSVFTHHFTAIFISIILLTYLMLIVLFNWMKDGFSHTILTFGIHKKEVAAIAIYVLCVIFYNLFYSRQIKLFTILLEKSLSMVQFNLILLGVGIVLTVSIIIFAALKSLPMVKLLNIYH